VHMSLSGKGVGLQLRVVATDAASHTNLVDKTFEVPAIADAISLAGRASSALREGLGDKIAVEERDQTDFSHDLDAAHEFAVAHALFRSGDMARAIEHAERALEKDEHFTLARLELALVYSNVGRNVDAQAQYKRALPDIDKLGERARLKFLADYYRVVTEEHERAIETYKKLLAKWPRDVGAEADIALSYQAHHELAKAREAGVAAAEHHPTESALVSNVPIYDILTGHPDEALAAARAYLAEFPHPWPPMYQYFAIASLLVGHRDDAVTALAKFAELDASTGRTAQADFSLAQ
jgi:tetratricopeptide (TPR) repeat protein